MSGKDFFRIRIDNESNRLIIDAAFYDRSGKIAFAIEEKIYSTSDDTWDVESVGNKIIFREGPGQIFLTVTLDGIKNTITISGKLFISGTTFLDLNDKGIQCNGYTLISNCRIENCETGLMVAEEAVLDMLVGGIRGGRIHNSTVKRCQVGFAVDLERIKGIFSRYPKGSD